jgi:hypothetical protein
MKKCFRSVKNGANIRSAKVSRGRRVPALCASQVGLSPVHQRRKSEVNAHRRYLSSRR